MSWFGNQLVETKVRCKGLGKLPFVILNVTFSPLSRSAVEASSNYNAKRVFQVHFGNHQLKIDNEIIKFTLVLTWNSIDYSKKVLFPI